jgi:hypothetical protein
MNDEMRYALLELNAVISEQPDCLIAYWVRGTAHAGVNNNLDAITDYAHVLKQADYLNARNRARLLDGIIMFGIKQSSVESQRRSYFHSPMSATAARTQSSFSLRTQSSFSSLRARGNSASTGVGRIAAVGRFLLDQNDLAKINQLVSNESVNQSNVRRLTVQAAEGLNKLLQKINVQPKVLGSCVIGRDGFLLASTLPKEDDAESFAIRSLAVYLSANNASQKIGHAEVRQSLLRSTQGYMIILDFSGGVLITVTNEQEAAKAVKLMAKIKKFSSKCDYAVPPAPHTAEKAHPAC